MKLPPTYSISITGSTIGVINQNAADHGHRLQYLLNRLLCGFEVADGAFEVYGLKVEEKMNEKPHPMPHRSAPQWLSSDDVLAVIRGLADKGADKACCWDLAREIERMAENLRAAQQPVFFLAPEAAGL